VNARAIDPSRDADRSVGPMAKEDRAMYPIYALLSLMAMTWAAAIWASFAESTGPNERPPYRAEGSKS
jgi:hypothetical protein